MLRSGRRDAPLERSAEHVAHAAFSLQRKPVFVFHIAWSITAACASSDLILELDPNANEHLAGGEQRADLVAGSALDADGSRTSQKDD